MVVVPPVPLTLTKIPLVEVPDVKPCVTSNASPVLLLARVNEVGVPSPDARVNAMFRPVVVVMVLPLAYADCKLCEVLAHRLT